MTGAAPKDRDAGLWRTGSMQGSADLRVRAAWLYHQGGLTQQEVSDRLGISRSTVIKLLDEARRRGEVQVWLNALPDANVTLAVEIEQMFGLGHVAVVPAMQDASQTVRAIGAALGIGLSGALRDGMTIGFGWGTTLSGALETFRAPPVSGVRVLSLLGGAPENHTINPVELAWQMAARMRAECLLFLAPLLVDSPETKRRLIENCGLEALITAARAMDIAVISCGTVSTQSLSLSRFFLPAEDQATLLAAGATCETICHFMTARGESADHPIHDRIMSVGIDAVSKARQIVLASGGAEKVDAIRATIKRVGCHVLYTDEAAARGLLAAGPLA
jgi:DNA-binding transcriptional regulator LsrR (DeoR family)